MEKVEFIGHWGWGCPLKEKRQIKGDNKRGGRLYLGLKAPVGLKNRKNLAEEHAGQEGGKKGEASRPA